MKNCKAAGMSARYEKAKPATNRKLDPSTTGMTNRRSRTVRPGSTNWII